MKRIRYGVIGTRGVGRLHGRLVKENEKFDLVAVADINPEAVASCERELNVRGFTDYRELLDAGIVDAVSIATPHHLHAPIALDCLEAGVHVYVEKPLANRVSEADQMIQTANARNLKICVGHQYRLHRSSVIMKQIIESGALGRILRVIWTWGEFRADSYYDRDLWRATWRHSGGGVLMMQASHDLDLLCWMVGKPVQVTALMGNQLHGAEIEDIVCASILFEGGTLASVQVTLNQPKAFSIRQIAGERGMIVMPDVQSLSTDEDDIILQGSYENALREMIVGPTGTFYQPRIQWEEINLGKKNGFNRLVAKSDLAQRVIYKIKGPPVEEPHPISFMLTSFAEAISSGGAPLVTAESARITVELINAIILSAMRSKTVTLPIDRGEYDQLFEELSAGKTQVARYRN